MLLLYVFVGAQRGLVPIEHRQLSRDRVTRLRQPSYRYAHIGSKHSLKILYVNNVLYLQATRPSSHRTTNCSTDESDT